MVPAGMGRASRPSAKNRLAPSGLYFGWSCISCRHAAISTSSDSTAMALGVLNFPNSYRIKASEKAGRALGIVQRIALLDAKEEAAARHAAELGQIEQWKMRPRKTAQSQRAEKRECPGKQHRQFE